MQDYRNYFREETICAVITPPGTGGVAIVRVSGPKARHMVSQVFSKNPLSMDSHTVHYGKIRSPLDGSIIDEGLCLFMKGPHSFTGEDVCELQFHGGNLVATAVMQALTRVGAQSAYPGEFSFRAYKHGKIDLIQAQAIQEMISARNEKSLKAAQQHLEGKLSKHLLGIKQKLLELAAVLEAWVDFPEEGLEFMSFEDMIEALSVQNGHIKYLIDSYKTGHMVFTGATLCLVGEPNVGKSSLMNALVGKERAIVTDIAGTTRDIIEEDLRLFDLTIRLKDTAGIRDTDEVIEKEGILRSLKALEDADLVLFIKDASIPLQDKERELLAQIDPSKTVFICNKIDKGIHPEPLPYKFQKVSAKFDEGVDELKKLVYQKLMDHALEDKEDLLIMDSSQKQTLEAIYQNISSVILGLQEQKSSEFVVIDLKEALKLLGSLIGIDVTEDVLSSLFSKFCVGK